MGQPESPAHLEHQNPKTSSWSWALLPQSQGFSENGVCKVREDTVWVGGASVKPLGPCRASRSDAPAGQSNFTWLPEGTPRRACPQGVSLLSFLHL